MPTTQLAPTESSQQHSIEERKARVMRLTRLRCLTDLFFLTQTLGFEDVMYDVHKPLCDVAQSVNPFIIHLAGEDCTLNQFEEGREYIRQLQTTPYDRDWETEIGETT